MSRTWDVNILRANEERRANWLYYLYDEMRNAGANVSVSENAIAHCGEASYKSHPFPAETMCELVEHLTAYQKESFEMKTEINHDSAEIQMHYCPFFENWKKVTQNSEDIAELCRIARKSYDGIFSQLPDYEFRFDETIACGGECCKLMIQKK